MKTLLICLLALFASSSFSQTLIDCNTKYHNFTLSKSEYGVSFSEGELLVRMRSNPEIRGSKYVESEGELYAKSVTTEKNKVFVITDEGSLVTFSLLPSGEVTVETSNTELMKMIKNILSDDLAFYEESCTFNSL
jgi:hypothetical protein